MRQRRVTVTALTVLMVVATVVVFAVFDSRSHSASDTLRPFLITMGPAWVLFILTWRLTTRPQR